MDRRGRVQRTHRRPLGLAVGALITVGIGGTLPGQAAVPPGANGATHGASKSGGVEVTPDGWIHYNSVLSKVGITGNARAVQGVREGSDGCRFSGSGSARAGDTSAGYEEEVAYNPATCEATYVSAPVSRDQLSQINAATGSADASSPALDAVPMTAPAGGALAVAAATVFSRTEDTSWIDPLFITITQQKAGLQWTSTAWTRHGVSRYAFVIGCIGSVCLDRTYVVSSAAPFLSVTGGWKQAGLVHYRNTTFAKWVALRLGATGWAACGFPTTFTADFWHDDRVTGYRTGSSAWSWDDAKSGACTNLVHHGEAHPAGYL